MSKYTYKERENNLRQKCVICREMVESRQGFIVSPAILSLVNNDVYHKHCAAEYYKKVQEKDVL